MAKKPIKKKNKKKVVQKYEPLQIIYIIDESGSMAPNRNTVISAFNEYIENMKENPNPNINLSLITFEVSSNERIKFRFSSPIKDTHSIDLSDYQPGGGTNLYDAIMGGINSAKSKVDTVVVIHTDGEENSSITYKKEDVIKAIKEKTDAGWVFIYIGAGQEAWSGAGALGIAAGNTVMTSNTNRGTRSAMDNVSIGTFYYASATPTAKLDLKKSMFGNDKGLDLTKDPE